MSENKIDVPKYVVAGEGFKKQHIVRDGDNNAHTVTSHPGGFTGIECPGGERIPDKGETYDKVDGAIMEQIQHPIKMLLKNMIGGVTSAEEAANQVVGACKAKQQENTPQR